MRRLLIGLAAAGAAGVVAAGPADAAPEGKPDGRAKVQGEAFVGQGVFTPPSPIEDQRVQTIGDTTFVSKAKNRGTQTDTIKARFLSTTAFATWDAFYKGNEVESGVLKLRNIAPGASSKPITIVADTTTVGSGGAQVTVVFKSTNNPAKRDSIMVVALNDV